MISNIPDDVEQRAQALGSRMKLARVRRKLRQIDLVERAGVSRSTLEAIERGDPATSLGAYLRVLWALGLDREVDIVADPGIDRDGLALELSVQDKRVRVKRSDLDNDF